MNAFAPAGPSLPAKSTILPGQLGCPVFRRRHHLKYAYVAGSMYKGIGSRELVVRMGRAGLIGFLGTGGMKLERIEGDLHFIQGELGNPGPGHGPVYGMNLLASPFKPEIEQATVDLFLKHGVPRVEAAAFTQVTADLVRYRVTGLARDREGVLQARHRVMAKVSRPEVAEQFLSPPPAPLLQRLLERGQITRQEAELASGIPMADDVCVEADSGGHTDRGVLHALLPVMLRMRDDLAAKHRYPEKLCIGAAGGLGTPHAVAAAFILGADFVLTGSVNQCTVEAGTSDAVKDLLQEANVQDTDIVPAGDMFEMGAKVQVFKKGLLFPARAKKLYDLYRQFNSLDEIDAATRDQIEKRYFQRTFEEVYAETRTYYLRVAPEAIEQAERHPKKKMALIFRWYFVHSSRLALAGDPAGQVDYQIHCGPALGAFNKLMHGTPRENWRARHVDEIADFLMCGAAELLEERYRMLRCATPDL